jgi:hypothetical protein
MKITLNLDIDTEIPGDIAVLSSVIESIRICYDSKKIEPTKSSYEDAWKQCSWEIITFALTVLKVSDGVSVDKGTFALFESLLSPASTEMCGPLSERSISSRVGRTAVICKNMGDFRLMEIAVRKKDQARRVYITPEAEVALLKLFHGDWGKDFNNYLLENSLKPDLFEGL